MNIWTIADKTTMLSQNIGHQPPSGGPGSVVGIVTGYGLDGPGIESRCG